MSFITKTLRFSQLHQLTRDAERLQQALSDIEVTVGTVVRPIPDGYVFRAPAGGGLPVWDAASGSGFNATMGTSTLDFGPDPAETASVVVTGQPLIAAASHAWAFFMRESTVDNDVDAHEMAAAQCPLVCGEIVPGTGFTIVANVMIFLASGTFKVRWGWQ